MLDLQFKPDCKLVKFSGMILLPILLLYQNYSLYVLIQTSIVCLVILVAQKFDIDEPKSFRPASSNSYWQQPMQEKFDALKSQGTWILVPPPQHRSVVR